MLKRFSVFGAVLIAIFSFALFGCGSANTAVSTNPGKITLEQFNKIKQGMTYQEVVQILGREGELMSEAGSMRMYTWTNKDDFSNMNATFNNNRVAAKGQLGLPSSGNSQQTQMPVQTNKTDKQHAEEAFDRGNKQYKNGDLNGAIANYSQAIRLDPKYAGAYLMRGIAYTGLSQYDKAIADCNSAIQIDPKSAEAYLWRGIAYTGLSQYDKAIVDYNSAIQIDPKSAEAYNGRGIAYFILKDYDKAIADYKKVLELKPDYTKAKENLQKALDAKAKRG